MKTPHPQSNLGVASAIGWSVVTAALAGQTAVGQSPAPAAEVRPVSETRARVEAVAGRLVPGKTNFVGLVFRIEKSWHIYWDGQNDTGAPPEFSLTLPEGWTQGKTRWPAPIRHVLPGDIVDYIYEGEATLLVPIDVPESAAGTEVDLAFDVRWLVCSDVCIPEKGTTTVRVRVAKTDAPSAEPPRAPRQIAETLYRRLPRPMKEAEGVAVSVKAGRLRIEAPGAKRITFMPAASSVAMENAADDGEVRGGVLEADFEAPDGERAGVVGIVQLDRGKGPESYWFDEQERGEAEQPPERSGAMKE